MGGIILLNNNLLIKLLAIMGLIDSLYISLTKYGCEICETVHNSIWGQPFGIPIAYFGALGYGLIYICIKTGNRNYGLLLTAAGAVTSMMLIIIQAFILKQFCVFCMISAGIMITLWLLLWYQERQSTLARFMPLAPILVAGVFIMLVLPYGDTANQPDKRMNSFDAVEAAQITDEKETVISQEPDKEAVADINLGEGKSSETAADGKETENVNEGLIDDNQKSEEVGSATTDRTAEGETAEVIQPEDPENTLTTFYSADGSPVQIDINKDYILFFSSHCEVCVLALEIVNPMSEQERPILIDIWIPASSDLDNEKNLVQEKLAPYSIDPMIVLYDLDRVNPVPKVPRFINQ